MKNKRKWEYVSERGHFLVVLVALLLCDAFIHVSYRPAASVRREKRQPPQHASNGHQREPDAFPNAFTGSENQLHSSEYDNGTEQKTSTWSDPIVLFTGGLLLVAYLQLRATSRQGEIANRQRKIGKRQLETQKLDQRAWLGATDFKCVPFAVGQPVRVSTEIISSGRGPALRMRRIQRFFTSFEEITDPEPHLPADQPIGAHEVAVFPGAKMYLNAELYESGIPLEALAAIKEGRLRLYIAGVLFYTDIHGGEFHRTRYFQKYEPSFGAFVMQSTHNDAT